MPMVDRTGCTDSGIVSETTCDSAMLIAKARAARGKRRSAPSPVNDGPARKTRTAPAAIPTIASETARNDRWYQVRTESSRPSRISSSSVAKVTQNKPAKSIGLFYVRVISSRADAEADAMGNDALIAEP